MDLQIWVLILLLPALVGIVVAMFRSRELFVLAVQGGRTRVVRGKPPHGLLQDLADVFERAAVEHAEVKVLREGGKPRLVASGLSEHALQRARNVLGAFPAHRLVGPS